MIYINGEELKITKFPNNESKIETPISDYKKNRIILKWESDEDFINLMFVKDWLDNSMRNVAYLHILYMPYSRMDRLIPGSLFTLKTICNFINSLNFNEVIVCESHSDVTSALLNKCSVHETSISLLMNSDLNPDYIFYPDAGAQKRYHLDNYKELVGFKERDLQTGRIKKYNVFGEIEEGSSIAIIDDLCSYGATFDLASRQLKNIGAGDIYLIVTHCEKSIMSGNIFKNNNIKKVLTTNSIIDIKYEKQINEEFGGDKISIKNLLN